MPPLLDAEEFGESRLWPVLAVVTSAALYATLPEQFIGGSRAAGSTWITVVRWLVPSLALVLLAPLALTAPRRHILHSIKRRTVSMLLIAVITAANSVSVVLLVHQIVNGLATNGDALVRAAIHIWCTNVLVFALWFWQLDSGGPMERLKTAIHKRDFLFPQHATPELHELDWCPKFLDYLYLSFTNATAFSPTDTMPLTRWAKMLMLVESAASVLIFVMVAARAVNIIH
jgi:uncharacterized membrane protein